MTQHVDAFGQPLEIGDTVSYVFMDYSSMIFCRARVTGFTPKRVKIAISEYRHNGELDQNVPISERLTSHPVGAEKTIMPHFLIKDGIGSK